MNGAFITKKYSTPMLTLNPLWDGCGSLCQPAGGLWEVTVGSWNVHLASLWELWEEISAPVSLFAPTPEKRR